MSEDLVRVRVDGEVCLGVGQCELLEADVFRLRDDDDIAVVIGTGVLPRARAERVIDKCPSGAISIAGEGD